MATIQHIRGTTTQWAASTYILAEAEIGIEIDNTDNTIIVGAKVGNGIELWSALDYLGGGGTAENGIPAGGTIGQILAKETNTDYDAIWIDNYATQVKHEVKLGESIAKGQAVYVSSANGTNMIVSKASNATEATSSKVLGLIETGGVTNDFVKVVTEGLISGLDTSSATAGDPVWLGTSGNLIFGLSAKPVAPAHLVYIGAVTRVQSENGEIFVNVQNGFEFRELHDVLVESPADNEIMAYDNASSLWKNQTAAEAGLATTEQGNPSGAIIMYGGSSAPSGWLTCDGSLVSRTTYSALFGIIGTTFGIGDGSTTFALPDMRGRVPVGVESGSYSGSPRNPNNNTLGSSAGVDSTQLTTSHIPSHVHGGTAESSGSHSHTVTGTTTTDGSHSHGGVTGSALGNHSHTVPNRTIVPGSSAGNVFESWSSGNTTSRTHNTSNSDLSHTHTIGADGSHSHTLSSGATNSTGAHTHTVATDGGTLLSATPTAVDNRQPYLVLNYIIKT